MNFVAELGESYAPRYRLNSMRLRSVRGNDNPKLAEILNGFVVERNNDRTVKVFSLER